MPTQKDLHELREQRETLEIDGKASMHELEKRAATVTRQEAALEQQQLQLAALSSQLQVKQLPENIQDVMFKHSANAMVALWSNMHHKRLCCALETCI